MCDNYNFKKISEEMQIQGSIIILCGHVNLFFLFWTSLFYICLFSVVIVFFVCFVTLFVLGCCLFGFFSLVGWSFFFVCVFFFNI